MARAKGLETQSNDTCAISHWVWVCTGFVAGICCLGLGMGLGLRKRAHWVPAYVGLKGSAWV